MSNSFRTWLSGLGRADAALAAALALLLLTALLHRARRDHRARWPELVCIAVFGAYLVGLVMVVLCPLPGLSPPPTPPWLWSMPLPPDPDPPRVIISTTLDLRDFFGGSLDNQNRQNLLLTVPFGFALPLVVHWRRRWLVAACALLSLALEGSQLLASLIAGWAYRSVDVNDYLANTAGTLLGLALFTWVAWLLRLVRPGSPGPAAAASAVTSSTRPGVSPRSRTWQFRAVAGDAAPVRPVIP
jgi:glycopeptide antibiotics resistance protein